MNKEENIFYVYLYLDPICRTPFYVGKGSGRRAYDHLKDAYYSSVKKTRRHMKIRKIHKQGMEPIVLFAYTKLTEEEAFSKEASLISHYGRLDRRTGCLTNLSDGGEGNAGERRFVDKKLYTVYHEDGRILDEINRLELREAIGSHQSAMFLLNHGYCKGWHLDEKNAKNPKKKYVRGDEPIDLYHIETNTRVNVTKNTCEDFGFTVDGFLELVRGIGKVRYGYCLVEDSHKHEHLHVSYKFEFIDTGEIVTETMQGMCRKLGVYPSWLKKVVANPERVCKGWRCLTGLDQTPSTPFNP